MTSDGRLVVTLYGSSSEVKVLVQSSVTEYPKDVFSWLTLTELKHGLNNHDVHCSLRAAAQQLRHLSVVINFQKKVTDAVAHINALNSDSCLIQTVRLPEGQAITSTKSYGSLPRFTFGTMFCMLRKP